MSINASREQRRQLERDNARQPDVLTPVNRDQWPTRMPAGLARVWRSKRFLVQAFHDEGVVTRLSVCRTTLVSDRWQDGISWDELQQIKSECGFGDFHAVEVYPADKDVVNDANMRHLWVLPKPLPFAWRKAP